VGESLRVWSNHEFQLIQLSSLAEYGRNLILALFGHNRDAKSPICNRLGRKSQIGTCMKRFSPKSDAQHLPYVRKLTTC
jgi:hypothetical protein